MMTMPGFGAEASLQGTKGHYRMAGIPGTLHESFGVLPQLPISAGGGTGCGSECKSGDGAQTCCCLPGQRCVSTLNTCYCEMADRVGGVQSFGYIA